MAAWDDTLTWSERDEWIGFDGCTPEWTLTEGGEVRDLHGARDVLPPSVSVLLLAALDKIVALLPGADSPVTAGKAGDLIVHPAAHGSNAA